MVSSLSGDGDGVDMMHNELSNHIEHAGATVVSSLSQDDVIDKTEVGRLYIITSCPGY